MNEVYNEIIGKVLKVKTTELIAIHTEKGMFHLKLMDKNVGCIYWFLVMVMDAYTMRPYSFFFTSRMSDDELEDTFAQFQDKINVLRNLNYSSK